MKLYICGLATDVCVDYTVMDAVSLGYEVTVVTSCCKGVAGDCSAVLKKWQENGITITENL